MKKAERMLKKAQRRVSRDADRLWRSSQAYGQIRLKFGEKVTSITFCHSPEGSGHEPEDDPEY